MFLLLICKLINSFFFSVLIAAWRSFLVNKRMPSSYETQSSNSSRKKQVEHQFNIGFAKSGFALLWALSWQQQTKH